MPRKSNLEYRRAPKLGFNGNRAFIYINRRKVHFATADDPELQRKYHQKCAELLATGFVAAPADSSELTVEELLGRFWHWAKSYYKREDGTLSNELEKYKAALKIVKALYGHEKAIQFGPRALKTCRAKMIEKDWVRKTINKEVQLIVNVFKWGAEDELVPGEIAHALQCVKSLRRGKSAAREGRKVRAANMDLVIPLEPLLPRQVWDMIRLQLLSGAREGELFKLTPGMIDRSTTPCWEYRPEKHKTTHHGRDRVIYFNAAAQEVLSPYLLGRPDDKPLFSPAEAVADWLARRHEVRKNGGTPLGYGNRPGTNRVTDPKRTPRDRYDKNSYRKCIVRTCDRAFPLSDKLKRKKVPTEPGSRLKLRWETPEEWKKRLEEEVGKDAWAEKDQWIKDHRWHPHQLRHNAATFIRRTMGLEAARALLGHSSASVTELYAEMDHQKAMEAAANLKIIG